MTIIIIFIFLILIISIFMEYKRKNKFKGRKKLTDEEFFDLLKKIKRDTFLQDQVINARNEIAHIICLSKTILLPMDSIELYGSPPDGDLDGDDFEDYFNALQARAQKYKIEMECKNLADLIELSIHINEKELQIK